ncbi:MAG: ABC transporter permease, partial [Thermomicrobiales bacterium]
MAQASTIPAYSLRPPFGERMRQGWASLRSNPTAMVGAVIVVTLLLVAIFAPLIAPYDPYKLDMSAISQPPSRAHLFGTDQFGRDVFSLVVFGSRLDLLIAMSAVIVSLFIGTLIGAIAAYLGGWWDEGIMRVMDILQAFPRFIFAMGIAFAIGPGLATVVIATSVLNIPGYARLMRSVMLPAKKSQYAMAAQ